MQSLLASLSPYLLDPRPIFQASEGMSYIPEMELITDTVRLRSSSSLSMLFISASTLLFLADLDFLTNEAMLDSLAFWTMLLIYAFWPPWL